MMNGHGDVTMGLLCGKADQWERVPAALASWGMIAGPFDCWLAERGLSTLFLRMSTASRNANEIAKRLTTVAAIDSVSYPGLDSHVDHQTASELFESHHQETFFGNMVTIRLRGGREAATRFIRAAKEIPFCPSLGELSTTLSHPVSTSHRSYSDAQLHSLGISDATIRLSIGLESPEFIVQAIKQAVVGMDS
jgi:cystathionine beta-lyase/cystathionine gamma-synthase